MGVYDKVELAVKATDFTFVKSAATSHGRSRSRSLNSVLVHSRLLKGEMKEIVLSDLVNSLNAGHHSINFGP